MAKISSYEDYSLDDQTEVSSSEKEKFEDTGVIPVSGQYETNGDKKTKSVKLKDLLTRGGGLPEYDGADINKVLTVVSSKKLDWIEPGLEPEHVYGEKGISVASGSASVNIGISTSGASDGDVLTYDSSKNSVKWAAGGGGGGSGWTKTTIDVSSQALQDGAYVITIPSNNTLVIVTGLGTNQARYDVKIIPPTVGSNEVINCAVEFKPVEHEYDEEQGEETHCIEVNNMYFGDADGDATSSFTDECVHYQLTLLGSFWHKTMESDE